MTRPTSGLRPTYTVRELSALWQKTPRQVRYKLKKAGLWPEGAANGEKVEIPLNLLLGAFFDEWQSIRLVARYEGDRDEP